MSCEPRPIGEACFEVFLAGLVIAGFLAVPLLNLLTPLFAAAMMVHLHKMVSARAATVGAGTWWVTRARSSTSSSHGSPYCVSPPRRPGSCASTVTPTCIVIPKGYRFALTVQGKDYHYDAPLITLPNAFYPFSGVASFFHDHPKDRPGEIYDTWNSLHFGPDKQPFVLLPVIPPK